MPAAEAVAQQTPEAAPTPAMAEAVESLEQSDAGRQLVKSRHLVFPGVMVFIALLTLGFIYDWRKGVFRWR